MEDWEQEGEEWKQKPRPVHWRSRPVLVPVGCSLSGENCMLVPLDCMPSDFRAWRRSVIDFRVKPNEPPAPYKRILTIGDIELLGAFPIEAAIHNGRVLISFDLTRLKGS